MSFREVSGGEEMATLVFHTSSESAMTCSALHTEERLHTSLVGRKAAISARQSMGSSARDLSVILIRRDSSPSSSSYV